MRAYPLSHLGLCLVLVLLGIAAAEQAESPWFRDATREYGPVGGGPPILTDLDGDGYPDLICDGKIFKNDRGRRFLDVTKEAGIAASGTVCVADIDNDGLPDIYFCGGTGEMASRNGVTRVPVGRYENSPTCACIMNLQRVLAAVSVAVLRGDEPGTKALPAGPSNGWLPSSWHWPW